MTENSIQSALVRTNAVYVAVARNLRDFGYPDVTAHMVREVHVAMIKREDLPHGVIGMFACDQIQEAGL